MGVDGDFFRRCNITKPWQAVLCGVVPGVFLFDPTKTKLFAYTDYGRQWKGRMCKKTIEYAYYACSMASVVTVARKYNISDFEQFPGLVRTQILMLFISAWLGLQSDLMPLLVSWVLRDRVYIKFPYRWSVLSSGWRDFWMRHSVHIGSALRHSIYYPIIKKLGGHPMLGVAAVFAFNALMHHWMALLIEDKPHFRGYCVGMAWMAFATFVEVILKRKFAFAQSKWMRLAFWVWFQWTLHVLRKIMIDRYRAIDVRFSDLQAK